MDNKIANRYQIITNLGSGGYSKVYLVLDTITNNQYALKLVLDENKPNIFNMFKQEAMTLASVNSKNVAKIYEFGTDDNHPYVVMEYIKGKTLKDKLIESGRLLLDEAYYYSLAILDGLEAMHNVGIVHRDIKSQNIIIQSNGQVTIVDFGTAWIEDDKYNVFTLDKGRIIGTVHYMDPELIRTRIATTQSDIYSFGILFYEMLSGKLPFVADDSDSKDEKQKSVMRKQLHSPFPSIRKLNKEVPKEIEKVIYKCTQKKNKRRYKDVSQVKKDLIKAYTKNKKENYGRIYH